MIEIDFCCIICFLVLLVKKKRPFRNKHKSSMSTIISITRVSRRGIKDFSFESCKKNLVFSIVI
jgi:hypothetical protein